MNREQKPRQQPTRIYVHWGTVVVAVIVTLGILYLVYLGYGIGWTGLGEAPMEKDVRPAKTLWEWLGLLIVPAILAVGGVLINRWQRRRDEANQRAQEEREQMAANQRAQDARLQAYLDQMSNLMVDKQMRKKIQQALEAPDEKRLAQARTLATLAGLDKDRKKFPLKLIYELGLITKGDPILTLKNAGLDTADLSEVTLHEACLREADLRRADLRGADLQGSDLTEADLRGADLTNANLSNTVLEKANLLPYDKKAPAKLNAPNLSNGTDPSQVDLSDKNLVPTKLEDANLSGAGLSGAYLTGANLSDAALRGADLSVANLRGAYKLNGEGTKQLITNEEVEQQVSSLKGATMPDGSIHD